jgi:hypothetical protein
MGTRYYINVGGGFTRTDRIIELADWARRLDKNIEIQAYDAVQGLQWNGGRAIFNHRMANTKLTHGVQLYDVTIENLNEAVRRVKKLNDHGVSFQLTLNNVLESVDLEDEDGNYLLRHLENDMNSVTVATRALTWHVKQNYPKFKVMGSICFAYGTLEEYIRACEIYDVVVMIPVFAYQPELLAKLPIEKLSFILNDTCALFCQRKDHYRALSRNSLAGMNTADEQFQVQNIPTCFRHMPNNYRTLLPEGVDAATCRRVEAIADKQFGTIKDFKTLPGGGAFNISPIARQELLRLGVNHFKLQGRELNPALFERQVVEFLEAFVQEIEPAN